MKILYAIQGTGNGHLMRAAEIIPALMKKCTVDILVSGTQADVRLRFPVKYRLNGLSFIFGKNGGVDMWKTFSELNLKQFRSEVNMLPVEDYNFVISDFEPVSAWACYQKRVPCYALSHQSSLLKKSVPKPGKFDLLGLAILRYYAPTDFQLGFHFAKYEKNIFTPVIRKEIREGAVDDFGHYTVYLPALGHKKIIDMLGTFKHIRWQVFSKHNVRTISEGNIVIHPIDEDHFTRSLLNCKGILCGAGFETPAEAIYLGKKLLVIPMYNQIEQRFNAAALKNLGVPVVKKLNTKNLGKIGDWLRNGQPNNINYPDNTALVVNRLFEYYFFTIDNNRKYRDAV